MKGRRKNLRKLTKNEVFSLIKKDVDQRIIKDFFAASEADRDSIDMLSRLGLLDENNPKMNVTTYIAILDGIALSQKSR